LRAPRVPGPARWLTGAVFALAGVLFWVSSSLSGGTNLRTDDALPRLSDLVGEQSRRNAALEDDNAKLRKEVDGLARRADRSGSGGAEGRKMDALRRAAGTEPVSGQGLTVTLKDAPQNARALLPGIPEPQVNDLVIHQQDIQAVVNALWAGGATGIRVMDQRLVSTSAVRCVGNTLILQGRVYSPPYTVTAVGDPGRLHDALDASPAIMNYLDYVRAYGLGWRVKEDGSVRLPAFQGSTDLRYARPTN
jgi:uncharacterized protein YlxW (UPF0749 family)